MTDGFPPFFVVFTTAQGQTKKQMADSDPKGSLFVTCDLYVVLYCKSYAAQWS